MTEKIHNPIVDAVDKVEETMETVIKDTDKIVEPVRKTAFHRFPSLFTLLVSFGVAATFFGFERLIVEISFLNNHPALILLIGIGVLVGTGTLYKKLG